MMAAELRAAGIDDGELRASYEQCRRLNARHGRTYFLATLLLPAAKRPHVHALYGFARYVDDIVDETAAAPPDERSRRLATVTSALRDGARDGTGVLRALRHTVDVWSIDPTLFDDFLRSMAMDLHVRDYATWADLCVYMHGSAAVIGLQMLPLLEPVPGTETAAAGYAADLGRAFQLTNFIRDVGEDLRRGRLYLPLEDLDRFGVTRQSLERGVVDDRTRALLAFEVERARALFRAAAPGIRLLHRTSRDCVQTAFRLYGGILDAVERNDYRVLDRRAAVATRHRLAVALPAALRAQRSRRRAA